MPPVISFHMGTLGFLTTFFAPNFPLALTNVLNGDIPLTVRIRLEYTICRNSGGKQRRLSADLFNVSTTYKQPKVFYSYKTTLTHTVDFK